MLPLAPFLKSQIAEDLDGARIAKEAIEATWAKRKESFGWARFKGINGGLSVSCHPRLRENPRFFMFSEALQQILSAAPFPPFDAIMALGDHWEEEERAPIFTFARKKGRRRLPLMPDFEALCLFDRSRLTSHILKESKKRPWHSKKDQVFWRGSPTGPLPSMEEFQEENWSHSPRFHLVKQSEPASGLVDAAFTSWDCIERHKELFAKTFRMTPFVHPRDHLEYKYLIDVDGNSCSYSRVYWIMRSNSLLLKQATDNVQWYYGGLVPFDHYVPVKQDLSDLEKQVEWLRKNEAVASKIIPQAQLFAKEHLSFEASLSYLEALLRKYSLCLDYTPTLQPEDVRGTLPFCQKALFYPKPMLWNVLNASPFGRTGFFRTK